MLQVTVTLIRKKTFKATIYNNKKEKLFNALFFSFHNITIHQCFNFTYQHLSDDNVTRKQTRGKHQKEGIL